MSVMSAVKLCTLSELAIYGKSLEIVHVEQAKRQQSQTANTDVPEERQELKRGPGAPCKHDWGKIMAAWSDYERSHWLDTPSIREFCEQQGISERSFRDFRNRRTRTHNEQDF